MLHPLRKITKKGFNYAVSAANQRPFSVLVTALLLQDFTGTEGGHSDRRFSKIRTVQATYGPKTMYGVLFFLFFLCVCVCSGAGRVSQFGQFKPPDGRYVQRLVPH